MDISPCNKVLDAQHGALQVFSLVGKMPMDILPCNKVLDAQHGSVHVFW